MARRSTSSSTRTARKGVHDSFVFAPSFERLGYGQERRCVATLDSAWRPWEKAPSKIDEVRGDGTGTTKKKKSSQALAAANPGHVNGTTTVSDRDEVIQASVRGLWRAAPPAVAMAAVRFPDAMLARPAAPLKLEAKAPPAKGKKAKDAAKAAAAAKGSAAEVAAEVAAEAAASAAAAPPAIAVTRCSVPMLRSETHDWPQGRWGQISLSRSTATFGSIAWITERLTLPPALSSWTDLSHADAISKWRHGESPCDACAPLMPTRCSG